MPIQHLPPKEPLQTSRVLTSRRKEYNDIIAMHIKTMVLKRIPPLKKLDQDARLAYYHTDKKCRAYALLKKRTPVPTKDLRSCRRMSSAYIPISIARRFTIKTACVTLASPCLTTDWLLFLNSRGFPSSETPLVKDRAVRLLGIRGVRSELTLESILTW